MSLIYEMKDMKRAREGLKRVERQYDGATGFRVSIQPLGRDDFECVTVTLEDRFDEFIAAMRKGIDDREKVLLALMKSKRDELDAALKEFERGT